MDPEHFGYLLKEARLRTGRSIDEIARRTKIPTVMLERIELGDIKAMPAEVFACGFLRAFAREVGVDGEDAVSRYRRVAKGPDGLRLDDPIVHAIDREAALKAPSMEEEASSEAAPSVSIIGKLLAPVDDLVGSLTARIPAVENALGRGPTFALVVLLVVLVATITLSLLLGGDPRPGRGLS